MPIIAVTATAPKAVESMICDSLSLQKPVVVSQSLDRHNIFLSCTKSRGLNVSVCNENGNFIGFLTYPYLMTGIISCLKGAKESKDIPITLVFCRTKEAAVNMYRLLLQSSSRRDYFSMFHASLTKATKQAIQQFPVPYICSEMPCSHSGIWNGECPF